MKLNKWAGLRNAISLMLPKWDHLPFFSRLVQKAFKGEL